MRDITRKINGNEALENIFAEHLGMAFRVIEQCKNKNAKDKIYSLYAPET